MATDQQPQLFSARTKTSTTTGALITDEDTSIGMARPAPAALDQDAGTAAASSSLESSLCSLQTAMAGAHSSIEYRSARGAGRELHRFLIPCPAKEYYGGNESTKPGHATTPASCPPILKDEGCSSKRTSDCSAPLQTFQVPATHSEPGWAALQLDDVGSEHMSPSMTAMRAAHGMQLSFSKLAKVIASEEESTENVEADKKQEGGEIDQVEEEEEGCVTPRAKDQQIPQHNIELTSRGLECPPAPKKKPCASKRRRLLCNSDVHDADVDADQYASYIVGTERRTFLVDPPDLHNFPDCIRALFK